MKHTMKLREIYFNKIRDGEKIYEIRLNDEKRKLIQVGDEITFLKEPELTDKITTLVDDLIIFNSFKEMTDSLNLSQIGFDNLDNESVINIYHQFYTPEDEKKFGVLAIKVKVLYDSFLKNDVKNYIDTFYNPNHVLNFESKDSLPKATKNKISTSEKKINFSRTKQSQTFDSLEISYDFLSDDLTDKNISLKSEFNNYLDDKSPFSNIKLDSSFSNKLLKFIDSKNMTDSECYKKANIDRKLFSKIRCNNDYQPSKRTVFAFAIALKLNIDETKELLNSAGYSLSHSYLLDTIVEYFIVHKKYNIFLVNEALSEHNQLILGSI